MTHPSLLELFIRFCAISLAAVGGASAVLPEMHRHIVETSHWLTSSEFTALYAIAQAAPGPNVLVVSLIGWKLAGIPGALACTIGMCAPSSILAFWVGRLWERFRRSPWHRAVEQGLAPITIGLILGSAWLISQAASHGPASYALVAFGAVASFYLRHNPLWWLATGALVAVLFAL